MKLKVICWMLFLGLFLGTPCYGQERATAVVTVTAGFVTGITLTSGGSGYVKAPLVTISGGGGSGASAEAILEGDRVVLVIILTAGSGYTSSPTVTFEDPPLPLGLSVALVPRLTVTGPVGSLATVQRSVSASGPWENWTNVVVGAGGTVLVDVEPGSLHRFYQAIEGVSPGPEGFVWIPPGTFMMGSPETEVDRDADEVLHEVTLTQGFWMSDHEVTQAEYLAVVGSNPSYFTGDLSLPVEQVTWYDATNYCHLLTVSEAAAGRLPAGWKYTLPTEAQWEYACRAGTSTRFSYGDDPGYTQLANYAWYESNSGGRTHPSKQKLPNAWGLYDMHGNVWEWCLDWYGAYPVGSATDPLGPSSGVSRVLRGGGWDLNPQYCRAADRSRSSPDDRSNFSGFRPALVQVP